jgi:hypothetical protein
VARAIVGRMLHEPTLRMKRSADDEDSYVFLHAMRELFGLDPSAAPIEGEGGEVRRLRPKRRDSA